MACRWGLATTEGAFHLWHTNCNGFGTYIDTQVGCKWWVVAQPKQCFNFSDTLFFSKRFHLSATNKELCDIEAVLLPAGSHLYAMSTNHPTII
jgi:hypothetical protein